MLKTHVTIFNYDFTVRSVFSSIQYPKKKIEGLKWKCPKCYRINKQIESFQINTISSSKLLAFKYLQ